MSVGLSVAVMRRSYVHAKWTVCLGECNEVLADKAGISRERQDEFAVNSHDLAERAWEEGFYDELVTAVPGVEHVRDESIRPGTTTQRLGTLRPAFRSGGTSSPATPRRMNDGASAVLIGSESAASVIGSEPMRGRPTPEQNQDQRRAPSFVAAGFCPGGDGSRLDAERRPEGAQSLRCRSGPDALVPDVCSTPGTAVARSS